MILYSLLVLIIIAILMGALLGFAAEAFKSDDNVIVDHIETVLPQTQCGQCGYPGCRAYARAVVEGEVLNKCLPGGKQVLYALSDLLGHTRSSLALEQIEEKGKSVVRIRESECIGCTKCIQVCPVDAIIGAPKVMHTVITEYCTGCDLCIPVCPVDCIEVVSVKDTLDFWQWPVPESV